MDILNLILTTLLSVFVLFVLAKLMGHKQIAQLDFFDYITGITIGSIAAELATELEDPWKPLIAMTIYGLIAVGLSVLTSKMPRLRKYINGTPTILMNNGKLYRENFKKSKLDLSEFMVMCRELGYFNLSDIQTAIFEFNGKLTVLPVSDKRPVNPSDMNLKPEKEYLSTEVIMDGRILEENLKRLGFEENWLKKQLALQGYKDVRDVFLGVCDGNKVLMVYPVETE